MRTLFLLRHAKSSWDDASLTDFQRPLNERGRRAARAMGAALAERELRPERIVSSPAVRASETAALISGSAGWDTTHVLDKRIYEAATAELVQVAAETDDGVMSLMLVGHNPGMERLIGYLTSEIVPMPTAAVAVIELDIAGWGEVDHNTGRLIAVLRPKELGIT